MSSALTRYRVMAWVVGVVLVVLVLIAVPVKYLAHAPTLVAVVGPLHGFLFIVYLLTVANLAFVERWSLLRTALVMLAGTVPFASIVAEPRITRLVRSRPAAAH